MSDILTLLEKSLRYEAKIKDQADLIERQRWEIALLHARIRAADIQLARVRRDNAA